MNNLFASKTLRDPRLHFSILRTRLCVCRLCMHAHTLVCFFFGADTEKRGDGGLEMNLETCILRLSWQRQA